MRTLVLIGALLAGCRFSASNQLPGDDVAPSDGTPANGEPLAFDPASCPSTYGVQLSSTISRYRVIRTDATFWAHEVVCNADLPGATHVIVLNEVEEIAQLKSLLVLLTPKPNLNRYFVGAVQDATSPSPSGGWMSFHGGPVASSLWSNIGANMVEPDDADGDEALHEEQLAAIETTAPLRYLLDVTGDTVYGAICECDGVPVAAAAAALIAADPNHP